MMTYSKTGRALTEAFEGCRLKAYQDVKGVWTIGYGHTTNVEKGDTCTQEQADVWLSTDILWAANAVNKLVTLTMSQGMFDALTDLVLNIGVGAFSHSGMLRLLNDGHLKEAAAQFALWDKSGGTVIAGLLRRREAEAKEFMAGIPA